MNIGFIWVIEYPTWLTIIIPVPKSGGKVRMSIGYRDLNKASLTDDYPLANINMSEDNTTIHALKSFVDGFAEYNQIKMHHNH